jgi:hypothetical protein
MDAQAGRRSHGAAVALRLRFGSACHPRRLRCFPACLRSDTYRAAAEVTAPSIPPASDPYVITAIQMEFM